MSGLKSVYLAATKICNRTTCNKTLAKITQTTTYINCSLNDCQMYLLYNIRVLYNQTKSRADEMDHWLPILRKGITTASQNDGSTCHAFGNTKWASWQQRKLSTMLRWCMFCLELESKYSVKVTYKISYKEEYNSNCCYQCECYIEKKRQIIWNFKECY